MTTARAHTNIALIKYWGKKDEKLVLPFTSSVSLTLNEFYTDTSVVFDSTLEEDRFELDGKVSSTKRITPLLDLVRDIASINTPARVSSTNHVPTAAGLASSASAFAALALASTSAAGLKLSPRELSRLARRGSGSASRSIFGGLAVWHRGEDDASSYAEPLPKTSLDLAMVVALVNTKEKSVGSRTLMANTVKTSPYFPAWVTSNEEAAAKMQRALLDNDFEEVGHLTELSASRMHASILAADPSFTYWEPDTLRVWALAQQMKKEGLPVYITMDAGPNVKLLTLKPHVEVISKRLAQEGIKTLIGTPGPKARLLEENA